MFLMTDPKAKVAGPGVRDFREIVEEHKRVLYYLCLDLTGNHHDAEDLSQDVFIKAYRALDSFRGDAAMLTWLRRIAVNTYLNRKKKKALSFMSLLDDTEGSSQDGRNIRELSGGRSPERDASGSVTRLHVERAMKGLSPRERSAFVLRHYQDLTVPDVARAMSVSDGTVKSLLFRATRKMRESLSFYQQETAEV
jgi:RNA polymerase sigma-70 factor, ECF subfamily